MIPKARSFQTKEELSKGLELELCAACGILTILIWLEPQACRFEDQGCIITRREVKKAEIGRHQIVLGLDAILRVGFTFGPVFLKMEPQMVYTLE